MTSSERANRIARNEATFRQVNAALHEGLSNAELEAGELVAFVCECGDPDCHELVRIPLERYEFARSSPYRFVLVPGHDNPDVERVVDHGDTWAIVEKLDVGDAREITETI